MKDLREILRLNSETTANLVLKVKPVLMRNVLRLAENQQQNANDGPVQHQYTTENRGDFNHDEVLR